MISKEEAKKIIIKLSKQLNVPPKLVTTRLLNDNDKLDLMNGEIPIASLIAHIEAWRDSGMPDYAHGKTILYEIELARAFYK